MNKKAIRKTQRTLPWLLQKWYQQLHSICRQIPLGKKDFAAEKSVVSIFFTDSWNNLEQVKNDKHSPTDCEWCLKNPIYKNTLSKLPIKTNAYRVSCMISMEKSQLFFRMSPMKLWVIWIAILSRDST